MNGSGDLASNYFYDNTRNLIMIEEENAMYGRTRYVYAGNRLLAKLEGPDVPVFYHLDRLGSPIMITDVNGNVIKQKKYEAFGNLKWQSGSLSDNREFTGKEKDKTGLHYFGARYYSADIGRFLSPDPMANAYTRISPYAYCANNPLSYVDPNGEFIWGAIFAAAFWGAVASVATPYVVAGASYAFNYTAAAIAGGYAPSWTTPDVNVGDLALQGAFLGAWSIAGLYVADALGGSTLAYVGTQAGGTFIGSGFDYVGVGPVNIPSPWKGWSDDKWFGANIGNIVANLYGFSMIDSPTNPGTIGWNSQHWTPLYYGGNLSHHFAQATGAYAVIAQKGSVLNPATLAEELTHVWQSRMAGSWNFIPTYLLQCIGYGYENSPYEEMAKKNYMGF